MAACGVKGENGYGKTARADEGGKDGINSDGEDEKTAREGDCNCEGVSHLMLSTWYCALWFIVCQL